MPGAREHDQTAVALNAGLEDDALAVELTGFGQTLPQPAVQAEEVSGYWVAPGEETGPVALAEAVEDDEEELAVLVQPEATIAPVPLTPPPSSRAAKLAAAAAAAVETAKIAEAAEEAEPESALDEIPAVEADVAPPRLNPVADQTVVRGQELEDYERGKK